MPKTISAMPRSVSKRIMKRAAEGRPLVITVDKNGKPSRVFGYEDYRRMKELPSEVKPWQHRKTNQSGPDPLGAVDGKVLGRLSRDEIYE